MHGSAKKCKNPQVIWLGGFFIVQRYAAGHPLYVLFFATLLKPACREVAEWTVGVRWRLSKDIDFRQVPRRKKNKHNVRTD
jgi:hypothetical protein